MWTFQEIANWDLNESVKVNFAKLNIPLQLY